MNGVVKGSRLVSMVQVPKLVVRHCTLHQNENNKIFSINGHSKLAACPDKKKIYANK